VCENKLCPFHVQPVQGLQQGQTSPATDFLDECYARLRTALNFCAVARRKGEVYVIEVRGCVDLIHHIQVTAEDILRRQLFIVRSLILRHCQACDQGEGGRFEQLLLLRRVHSVRWQAPTTRTRSTLM
jgi:hypothetical protein